MFTPQEIQEQTFSKAVFGGYDMQQVDEFLEPLTEDYIALYKENSVLKSKMKILVEKLEEYRSQEADMKRAVANTQATCDKMLREAQEKCAAMAAAVPAAAEPAAEADVPAPAPAVKNSIATEKALAEEIERVNCAKQTALNFINVIEQDIKGHLDLLESLKSRDLTLEEKPVVRDKPYDWSTQEPSLAPEASADLDRIAAEISESLEKLDSYPAPEDYPAPVKPSHPESATIKFTDLKFGKNYDPTNT